VGRRIFTTGVAIVASMALLLPMTVAGAHDFTVRPRISIDKIPNGATDPGERVIVHGDINGKRLCRRDRVVTLFEVQSGSDRRIDTDRSDREGEFRFVLHPDDDMTVYARIGKLVDRSYDHRHVCRKARSERLSINVSG